MKKFSLLLPALIFSVMSCLAQTPGSECEAISGKAANLYQQQKYSESIEPLESALRLCSRDSGMKDDDYYYMLAVLTECYFNIGKRDSAIKRGEPVAGYFEKMKRTNDAMYNKVMIMLGHSYSSQERYPASIECFEIALPYYKKTATTKDFKDFYLLSAVTLAEAYTSASMFEKSLELNSVLVNEIRNHSGALSPIYSRVVTNIGNTYYMLGVYDSAMSRYRESLQIVEKLFGKEHVSYAEGLNNIGLVYKDRGVYADAVSSFEQAVQIFKKNNAAESISYAEILGNLGNCYMYLGNSERAQQLFITSVELLRKNIASDYNIKVIRGIANLAFWYKNVPGGNDTIRRFAVNAFHHVRRLMETTKFTENSNYATVLSNIGDCYVDLRKYDSAITFIKASLDLKKKLKTENTDGYAISLGHLAAAYKEAGQFNESITYYNHAITLLKGLYGDHFPSVSSAVSNLATTYFAMKDYKTADSLFKYQYLLKRRYVLENTEALSEAEKEDFALTLRLINYMASNIRTEEKSLMLANDWVLNNAMFYKGLLLESSRGLTTAFSKFTDPSLKKAAQEFLDLKTMIGQELLKPLAVRSKNVADMQSRANTLERDLAKNSSDYRNWKDQFNIDWMKVRQNLKEGEVAIEFVSYYMLGNRINSGRAEYAALLIRKGKPEPEFIHLFSETAFNKLLSKSSSQEAVVKKLYRSTIKSASSQPQASDSLYHLIWKPLMPHLQNVKSIYFAADGVINNLNLAAIIKPDGKRLVEDYEFIQLSSTRNMLKNNPQPTFSNMQLWGGVQYDGNSSTSNNRSAAFTYLPGTLTEVNEIVSTANQSGKKSKTFIAADANESAFKSLSGNSPEVLHIATHGFFFPDPSKETQQSDNRFAQSENPLLRSGLALANANSNWNSQTVSADQQDGILTAYEIADMDLSNTKLVVLSACETGLGDVKSGEGVYGLQRAFKMAGVNYLIMSLWQVPDLETKEFMQTFYKKSLAGTPIRKAFRETQLAMNQKYQPYQWAAFVLVE